MTRAGGVVYLVDDDSAVREALSDLFSALEIEHVTFGTAAEFLAFPRSDSCSCLVLDVHLPDINGLDLQYRLESGSSLPIIFISGGGDIPSTVRAMKAGAVEFLTKPIDPVALTAAIREACARDSQQRQDAARIATIQQRYARLSPREREALPLIVGGLLNKQAASVLGISEVTIQVHRGQIMKKMQAESFADLVRMAGKLGIPESTL
jgi:FixJ family two-component response regulator